MRHLWGFTIVGWIGLQIAGVLAQDLGCPDSVTLNGGTIEISADSSGDDTENLQCAIDAATSGGYRDILLTSSEYSISSINATGFVGDLRGQSKTKTAVSIQDSSLSCDGKIGVALGFRVGTASVRSMSLSADSPCGNGGSASIIAYFSNPDRCSSRATFGNVDRVIITGQGTSGLDTVIGVLMQAAPGCTASNERITGTLKVNRSELNSLDFGIMTSIAAGGQVDINYNDFAQVGTPITIIDASQSTTILYNTIAFNDVPGYPADSGLGTTGIYIANTADSPNTNGSTLKNNTFNDGGSSSEGYAILVGQTGRSVAHKMVVNSNIFQGSDINSSGAGLAAIDTKDGLVSGNRFNSGSGAWIDLRSGDSAEGFVGGNVTGWAIVANIFSNSTADTDVVLGTRTTGIIVGKGQNFPIVNDQTANNDVLESASAIASNSSSAKGLFRSAIRERFNRQLAFIQDIMKP